MKEKNTKICPSPTLVGDRPVADFAPPLVAWYRAVARPLPWRADSDPYHIWLSEVMLQQTRVEAVRPYYARFLAAAPTIAALAALDDDRLMKLWEGLGYYSRARNLRRAAAVIVRDYGGEMPTDYAALRALPGIGDYTAGAIASLAFGRPTPAVDGNVLRVLSRLTSDPADVLLPDTKKRMTATLAGVYAALCPGDASPACAALTQALMELGQTLCLPGRPPLCDACPLRALCRASAEGAPERYPTRHKNKEKKTCRKLVLILHNGEGRFALRRRPEEGLLSGLWELPVLDAPDDPAGDAAAAAAFCRENGLALAEWAEAPPARHLFTHLVWEMRGLYGNVQPDGTPAGTALTFATADEIGTRYALPSALRAYVRLITNR